MHEDDQSHRATNYTNYTELFTTSRGEGGGGEDVESLGRKGLEMETLERRRENVEQLAALLSGDGRGDVDWGVLREDWDDRTAVGDGAYLRNEDGERVMAVPSPPPPAPKGRVVEREVETEAAAEVSCAGQALGAQDDASKPRLPAGCLTRDPNIFD